MQIRFIRLIDELFAGIPQSRKVLEMKEEIVQNLMEKYNDLVAEGKTEEAAFDIAAASVGDVNDLLDEFGLPRAPEPVVEEGYTTAGGEEYAPRGEYAQYDEKMEQELRRHRRASVTAFAVMLYILCPVPIFIFQSGTGIIMLFLMIALATGILIYNGMTNGKSARFDAQYTGGAQTWEEREKAQRRMVKSLSSAFWMFIVVVYFLISFQTGAWYITWIIFLIGAALSNIVHAYLDLSKTRK